MCDHHRRVVLRSLCHRYAWWGFLQSAGPFLNVYGQIQHTERLSKISSSHQFIKASPLPMKMNVFSGCFHLTVLLDFTWTGPEHDTLVQIQVQRRNHSVWTESVGSLHLNSVLWMTLKNSMNLSKLAPSLALPDFRAVDKKRSRKRKDERETKGFENKKRMRQLDDETCGESMMWRYVKKAWS